MNVMVMQLRVGREPADRLMRAASRSCLVFEEVFQACFVSTFAVEDDGSSGTRHTGSPATERLLGYVWSIV